MTKWDYIRMISTCGTHYGGVLDLLEWRKKPNTDQDTLEEAKTFWEMYYPKQEDKG